MHETCAIGSQGMIWGQLLGVGLLWITLHCSGMCGPILTGLLVHHTRVGPADSPIQKSWKRVQGVLAYQSGRAVVYVMLGGMAGWLGASVEGWVSQVAQVASVVAALLITALAWGQWRTKQGELGASVGVQAGRMLGRVMHLVGQVAPQPGPGRMALFGGLMGFLPCMVMFWVLGLAISSADPLQGAALMLTLVLMTTPMMLAVACSITWLSRGFAKYRLTLPLLLSLSSIWMILVALAANGVVAHQSLNFDLFSTHYTIMFW